MIVRVLNRGKDMSGLVRYLYSEGRGNEHTDQHMIAGSPGFVEEWGGWLDPVEAAQLGRVIEASWRHQYVEHLAGAGAPTTGGISAVDLHSSAAPRSAQEHVYHVTMSQPAGEDLTDEQWATLAQEWVDEMGFTKGGEHGCQWAAVRHGLSKNGNDHIHLAINLVRQDGHRAETHNDFTRSRRIVQDMERRHAFLTPVRDQTREQQPAMPSFTHAEARRGQERERAGTGPAAPDRVALQRAVRGAAEAARTEHEWVNNVLDARVDIEPVWADPQRRERVVGYTVQLGRPAPQPLGNDAQVRFAGTSLAPDLSLPQLRARWAANETDQTRADALELWRGDASLTAPAAQDPTHDLRLAEAALVRWNSGLEQMDAHDPAAWKREIAHAAGTYSLIASRTPGADGDTLGSAADRLNLLGHSTPEAYTPHAPSRATDVALAARHINLALRAGSPSSERGWFAVLQQLARTARAMQTAAEARGDLAAARGEYAAAVSTPAALIDRVEARQAQTASNVFGPGGPSMQDRVAQQVRRARGAPETPHVRPVADQSRARDAAERHHPER